RSAVRVGDFIWLLLQTKCSYPLIKVELRGNGQPETPGLQTIDDSSSCWRVALDCIRAKGIHHAMKDQPHALCRYEESHNSGRGVYPLGAESGSQLSRRRRVGDR